MRKIKPVEVKCAGCGGRGTVRAYSGSQLRERREAAELSLRELAVRVGFSPGYLSDLELGRRNVTEKVVRLYEREIGRTA